MSGILKKYGLLFPQDSEGIWNEIQKHLEKITEIRIRAEQPILVYMNQKEVSIDQNGNFIYVPEKGVKFSYHELQKLVDFWCMDSRYAFQNEIKRGFLTIQGGHRIGVCGETVSDEKGYVQSIKYISAINIRVAHEVKHAADQVMKYMYTDSAIENTLIISPPGCGKTTLLRDLIRQLSYGDDSHKGINVGVVDERGEIAACFQGIPQLDVGPRTDVLDNCQKSVGMRMLLRSMSPAAIAVDELGSLEEMELIRQMTGNGCGVIATVHGNGIQELGNKKMMAEILKDNIFKNIICISKDKSFQMEVYSEKEGKICCRY